MERSPKDVLLKMLNGSVYHGSSTIRGDAPRISPGTIHTLTYIVHSPNSYCFLAVMAPFNRNIKERLRTLNIPEPTFLLTPRKPKDYPNHWLIWEMLLPVMKSNTDAVQYYRDIVAKLSRRLSDSAPVTNAMCGNPFNKTVWSCEFLDKQYELKHFREDQVEMNKGLSEGEFQAILEELTKRTHEGMREDRRRDLPRSSIERNALEFGNRFLIENHYSFLDFGSALNLLVQKYLEVLMMRPAEIWRADLAERQSHRGRLKGKVARDENLEEALRLREDGYSNREIGRRLFKDHKTIAAWFKNHDEGTTEE